MPKSPDDKRSSTELSGVARAKGLFARQALCAPNGKMAKTVTVSLQGADVKKGKVWGVLG
jgi:hypothetical protein